MRTTTSRFNAFTGTFAGTSADAPTSASTGLGESGGPQASKAAPPLAGRAAPPSSDLSAIERHHPAVTQALTLLWGRPEMNQYFQKVASGLDPSLNLLPAAMAELLVLAELHRRICPYQPAKSVEELYGKGRWADTWKPARHRG